MRSGISAYGNSQKIMLDESYNAGMHCILSV